MSTEPPSEIDMIEGYLACRACGNLTLITTWHQTRGLCFADFIAGVDPLVRELEVRNAGKMRKVTAVRQGKKRPNRTGKRTSPEMAQRATRARNAKLAALYRLGHLYPAMFDVLLAEERWKRSLPIPANPVEGYLIDAVVTYQPNSIYPRGVDETGEVHGNPAKDEATGAA